MSKENGKYLNLHIEAIGYLNSVREVTPEEGTSFLAVQIGAIHGSVSNVQHTYFECVVCGEQAQKAVRDLKPSVEGGSKVLIGFTLSGLKAEPFMFKQGEKAGQLGVNLKSNVIKIASAKVDGERVPIEKQKVA